MRRRELLAATASALALSAADRFDPDAIIALERAALDRWGKGDPQGYLELYAPGITYFDPMQEQRVDGIDAIRALLAPLTGKIRISRAEMTGAKVQRSGDLAALSFQLASHSQDADGRPTTRRWNTTSVYQRIAGQWRIVHHHWSFTKPA
jgi:uncharacterized protein (TIGR02246 family)